MAQVPAPAQVVLYHAPPSFYSQIARLVLSEKGVAHSERVVMPGPPTFETYAPWYMRLNPGGTVPTLVADGTVIADSREILGHVDAHFVGPALLSGDAEVERWIELAYGLSERELAYASGRAKRAGRLVNALRQRRLEALAVREPDLEATYRAKLEDIKTFIARTADVTHGAHLVERYRIALDDVESRIRQQAELGHDFLAGPAYSLADLVWTVAVARQEMLHLAALAERPHLAAWYARMKERPSFTDADVWEGFSVGRMVRMVFEQLTSRRRPPSASTSDHSQA